MAELTEEQYIAKMIAKGHSQKRAESYWAAKSGEVNLLDDDDDAIGASFGGPIGRARDPAYAAFDIGDIVPNRKGRAEPRTTRIIDEESDRMIDIFRNGAAKGIPVVRKVGDRRRFEVVE